MISLTAATVSCRFDTIERRCRWGALRKRRFTRRSVALSQWTTQMWPEHVSRYLTVEDAKSAQH